MLTHRHACTCSRACSQRHGRGAPVRKRYEETRAKRRAAEAKAARKPLYLKHHGGDGGDAGHAEEARHERMGRLRKLRELKVRRGCRTCSLLLRAPVRAPLVLLVWGWVLVV